LTSSRPRDAITSVQLRLCGLRGRPRLFLLVLRCRAKDRFELADRLCRQEPRICDPNRERAEIDATTLAGEPGNVAIAIPGTRR
jgi:hypothetical protein